MTMTRSDFEILAEEISEIESIFARKIACEAICKAAKRSNNRFMVYKFAEACKLKPSHCAYLEARM